MTTFNYEINFKLSEESSIESWIDSVISDKGFESGELNFIFCDDHYLHKLNVEFLHHDTLTDIISFDNSLGKLISGDIFISVERVKENAGKFQVTFDEEIRRVMIHGILHFLGYKDKCLEDAKLMREEENLALLLLHK